MRPFSGVCTAAQRSGEETWKRVYTHAALYYINYHRRGGIGDSGSSNANHLAFFQLPLPLYQTTMLDGRIYQDIPCLGFSSCSNSLVLPPEAAVRLYEWHAISNGTMIVDDLETIDDLRVSEREVFTAFFCNETISEEVQTPGGARAQPLYPSSPLSFSERLSATGRKIGSLASFLE